MNHEGTNAGSPKEQERQLTALKYLLLHLLLSQKEAAAAMGVSGRTVSRMVKKHKLKPLIRQRRERGIADSVKYDDSLTAFVAYARVHNKPLHDAMAPVYKQYLETL